MKKNFLLMCGLLLSVCGFVACSDDNTTPAPEPTFPELVTLTAEAGEVIELSFSANYDWTATISEDTYTYFQLLSGETAVNTLSGVAGEQTIKVNVEETTIYDNAPVAEVTLTMNGVSQVIAKITYPVTEREVAVYAPVLNQTTGAFQTAAYDAATKYTYSETAMAEGDVVAMQYGRAKGVAYSEPETFFAPVNVSANFAYTLVGPEWMVAAETGTIGAMEHIIKADVTKIPAASGDATIQVLAGEEAIAEFKVSIVGYNDYIKKGDYIDESFPYQPSGEPAGFSGFEVDVKVATPNTVAVDANGTVAEWVTFSSTTADEETLVFKNHTLTATVSELTEGGVRSAYVFCFPNTTITDYSVLFDAEGNVKSEYEKYFLTIINQFPAPGTIEEVEVDEMAAAFGEPSDKAGYFFEESAFNGLYFGDSKYELNYMGQFASEASQYTTLKASSAIKSFRTFSNTDNGFAEIADNKWAYGQLNDSTESEPNDFKILVDMEAASAELAEKVEWSQEAMDMVGTGLYEAVIVVEFENGTCAAIYFTYTENEAAEEVAGLTFQYAEMGYPDSSVATLVEQDQNSMLYWEYHSTYPDAKIYELSYFSLDSQSMCGISGLEGLTCEMLPNPMGVNNADWLEYSPMQGLISMYPLEVEGEMQYSLQGAMIFKDENDVVKYVIVCTLFIETNSEA